MVELLVLDSNLDVVSHVRSYPSTILSGIRLSQTLWTPEQQGPLLITDSQGMVSTWLGTGADGKTQLPNGYYIMELRQVGAAAIDVYFSIKHGDYNGAVVVPESSKIIGDNPLILHFSFPENIEFEARIYNLAGELVAQGAGAGSSGILSVEMKSASGQGLASGIYLVQIRGRGLGSGSEILKLFKIAVLR
jgi:hypothetical protein